MTSDGTHSHSDSSSQEHGGHDDHGGHDHGHGASERSTRTLALVAAINVVGFLAELAGGLLFGSVALLSDAVHMLFDALAYVLAYGAASVADRSDASDEWSYGLHRLEPLAAFANGLFLVPMVVYILYESYQRFLDPVSIGTGPTLALAVAGLGVNLVSVYVLQGGEMSLNERGAFYHLLGDAGGSVAVIVSTVVVRYTSFAIVDPLTAVLIASVVLWSAGKLLRASGEIFLHRTPISQEAVRNALDGTDGVESVADLHTWQICSELTIATTHVHVDVDTLSEAEKLRERVHRTLADYDVEHATVELCATPDDRRLDTHSH
ncbi:cation diffusion facilitator family transporter [Halomicrococcus sp. NG-SE-24]|uniref:cation diffusion facilitator family transporter n=1 Tax=Halomicrococcus sp. NG-SE-24 TaxID=3436928 RepID=UPI003D96CAA4